MKIAFLLLFISFSQLAQAKRVALVLGNAKYFPIGLPNASNDAREVAKSFREIGFEVVLEYHDLTLESFRGAISELKSVLSDDDILVFFYAGHAMQAGGVNYLLPIDAVLKDEEDIQYETFNVRTLFKMLESKRTKANIIILDACRDNKFSRSVSRSGSGDGLAPMDPPINTLVAFSTKAGATASDGPGAVNSPYTTQLLQHLKSPNMPAQTMFQNVRNGVVIKTNGTQIPTEYTLLTENVILNPSENTGNQPDPTPTNPTGPTNFQDIRQKIVTLLYNKPIRLSDRTVITGKIDIKENCSFEIEKTYDFNSQYFDCKTSGNLSDVNLNYTFQPSSGDSFPTFQNVTTSCKRNEWVFYNAKTWVFHVPPKDSKEVHDLLGKLKLLCR
jgi:hypothetical protein